MKHSSSCAGPLKGTTPRTHSLGLSTGWILSQGTLFPVSQCSSVNSKVKNDPSFKQSTQDSIYFPFPGSTPPSSNPAPTSQDSNLGLCQQCPAQLLSLLISQGGSRYRQWPCPCPTMTLGCTGRGGCGAVQLFQTHLLLPGAELTHGRHS